MLRDKNLIPLSRQHQHALALCVRIERAIQAGEVDVAAFQDEIRQIFEQEIRFHFEAEEKVVFPAADKFPELNGSVAELFAEHAVLRQMFELSKAGDFNAVMLKKLASLLSSHIRKEERQLFERMQILIPPHDMREIGTALQEALAEAQQACLLPNEVTRLRPKANTDP